MASESTINYSAPKHGERVPEPAMAEMRLYEREVYWRERYNWLKDCGYLLRPRYHPDWVPSWKGKDIKWVLCEDGQVEFVSK